ncbi:DUF1330 domain-containing protein (plasmid) [Agrobacterium fabrum]|jgi:uncharacterized protein (DUF1330 family)|uniref:DUF1330 domain-containing protein n=1 Tax=Rhizobium/Agrobacterium group TaxID=227290 RepID=UPI0004D8420C|nr:MULTISPECIES: DUF1330 domain-containing protein [Rhizobium/Agrobacterium group]KEA04400.1 hypothetical protein CN09_18830 [Rhizobium rhizogenes]NMV72515.1 DUF1330 domain-containing protein [Agrobacterium fabrum]NTI85420.1 DUF1330 domain-containing protein [Rhizobium rhizogenes]NTJ27603.1 DUF1330 domain-containing protein [Rhizobium rhizogenes]QRM41789.1 DUF1330 domain-containing protein [Rhizobium rhizogenes]
MKKARVATLLVGLGAATFSTLSASSAQEPAPGVKPAYYISEFQVTDPEGIKPYSAQVESTFKPFGGRFIVRGGGNIASLEGSGFDGRMVVIAFDSMDKAKAWYSSPEYEKLKPIRHKSATSRVYIVEGPAS